MRASFFTFLRLHFSKLYVFVSLLFFLYTEINPLDYKVSYLDQAWITYLKFRNLWELYLYRSMDQQFILGSSIIGEMRETWKRVKCSKSNCIDNNHFKYNTHEIYYTIKKPDWKVRTKHRLDLHRRHSDLYDKCDGDVSVAWESCNETMF